MHAQQAIATWLLLLGLTTTANAQQDLDARLPSGRGTLRQLVYLDVLNFEQAEQAYFAANGVFTTNVDLLRPHLAYDPSRFLPYYAYLAICANRSEQQRATLEAVCPRLYEPDALASQGFFASDGAGSSYAAQFLDDRQQRVDVAVQFLQLGFSCAARLEAGAPPRSIRCTQTRSAGQPTEYWVDNPPRAVWVTPSELQSLLDAGRHRTIRLQEVQAYQERHH
jgi:hypothetical protein